MNRADDSTEHRAGSNEPDVVPPAPRSSPLAPSAAFAFHSDDVEHVANYQSLSVLALISLILGLASPLCTISRVFLLLPLCGLAVSLLALRRIALSEGRLAGRWAAVIGLALCVASGATAITRDAVVRSLRTAQAEEFARSWLTLVVSNQTDQAFKATYEGSRPLTPPEPGVPTPEKSPLETFLDNPLIQKLTGVGNDAEITYVDTLDYTNVTRHELLVQQHFSIAPAGNDAKSTSTDGVEAYLTLQRLEPRGSTKPRWRVIRYEPNDAQN